MSLHNILKTNCFANFSPFILACLTGGIGQTACTDGELNSGADFGSKITDNQTIDTATTTGLDSETNVGFPSDTDTPAQNTDTGQDTDSGREVNTTDDTDTASAQKCGGSAMTIPESAVCWHLSNIYPLQSCTDVCAFFGGVDPTTPQYIGAAAEGGSADTCNTLFYKMLGPLYLPPLEYKPPTIISAPASLGLGCYHNFNTKENFWVENTPFDPSVKLAYIMRICGCNW